MGRTAADVGNTWYGQTLFVQNHPFLSGRSETATMATDRPGLHTIAQIVQQLQQAYQACCGNEARMHDSGQHVMRQQTYSPQSHHVRNLEIERLRAASPEIIVR